MGFNYLRLALSYKDFSEDRNGTLVFYQDVLENIDRIVEWCAEYKVHLCLGMHELPGYTFEKRDILENPVNYQKALLVWNVISLRYAYVPSNLFSYNLVNEPDCSYFSENSYAGFAKDMISAIRTNDKTNKLLVSDEYELKDAEDIVISKHKPICINKVGVSVFDDAGGLSGFTDLLGTIYEEEDKEEMSNARAWAKSLGWSDRKVSNKMML